jgi:uncharacterized membrane protein
MGPPHCGHTRRLIGKAEPLLPRLEAATGEPAPLTEELQNASMHSRQTNDKRSARQLANKNLKLLLSQNVCIDSTYSCGYTHL